MTITPTANELKAFFRQRFQIPVRAKGASKPHHYASISIVPNNWDKAGRAPLTYDHRFPDELGNLCMRIIYPDSETLREQNWGGNIRPHDIAMNPRQWVELFRRLGEQDAATVV